MKNYLLIGVAFLLLLSCVQIKKAPQDIDGCKYKKTTIYLKLIKEIPKDSVVDLGNYIEFSDDRGNNKSKLVKPDEFTSIVNPGKKVTWKSAKGSIEQIKIIKILFKNTSGNVHILTDSILRGNANEVDRRVKNSGVKEFAKEHYSIVFSINKVIDTIDPAMQYHE